MILIIGATGCVGSALAETLLGRGTPVRVLVRRADAAEQWRARGAQAVVGDLLSPGSLRDALADVDTIFDLAQLQGPQAYDRDNNPATARTRAFQALAEACASIGIAPRLVYLGGLAQRGECSPLESKGDDAVDTVALIRESGLPYTIFLTGLVIAPRSPGFRLLHNLVAATPLVPMPRWTIRLAQPIALGDLMGYLADCLTEPLMKNDTFDLAGPEVLSYEEILRRIAVIFSLRRMFIRAPVTAPHVLSRTMAALTGLPQPQVLALLRGFDQDSVVRDNRIQTIMPRPLAGFEAAVRANTVL